ncbi:MAG: hypothetical protein Q8K92_09275 [Leadbetterella sp.]|nr:hypothetical protein [Leadbetterella sp.]
MEHLQVELSNLITALSEENFNILIREFNKEYYESNDVRIVNGPYDGGIDLEVHKDGVEIKRNIQITVQKTKIESKLRADIQKAKENSKNFGYQKNLDFYCTIGISGEQKRLWKRMALVEYGIDLTLYDCKSMAALSSEHSSIKKTLYKILGVDTDYDLINVDKHTKVLYDMFAIGKDAGELRKQFLHSLIITFIFENLNCTVDDIIKGLSSSLNHDKNIATIIQSQIDSLRTKGTIINGSEKFKLDLEAKKRNEIQELLDAALAQESVLKMELEACLLKYDLATESKYIVEFIYKSFQANYDADLEELSKGMNNTNGSVKRVYSSLIKFLNGKLKSQNLAEAVSREILNICTQSEYLNKISASILFTKLFQSDKLESYINQREQILLLDTQILLRIVCLDISKSKMDFSIQSVANFLEVVKKYKSRIFLKTTDEYLKELIKQIKDALDLNRFFRLPIVQKIGAQTNNVIYNYYKTLVDSGLYDEDLTIEDFVSEILDLDLPATNSKEFSQVVYSKIEKIFSFMDIEVIYMSYHDEFTGIKKEFETSLYDRSKSTKAIEHDVNTVIYLSDPNAHLSKNTNIVNEPFLITWDKSFYAARKRILEKYSHRNYWYIYTPAKYADRLSLQNFQLNPTAISNNIVSLTESSFNNASKTSFIDIMSSLFKSEDLSDIKIATRLIQLEEQNKPLAEDAVDEQGVHEDSPLIRVLLEVKSHYLKSEAKFNLDELVSVFENTLKEEDVFRLILNSVESYKSTKRIAEDLFLNFDQLIMLENKNQKNA